MTVPAEPPAAVAGDHFSTRGETHLRGALDLGAATVRVVPTYTAVEVFGRDRHRANIGQGKTWGWAHISTLGPR